MPVGTQAAVKGVLPRDLVNDLDAKIILGNTYHLFLRPGHETVRKLGGLHGFMNWPRAILTDSGGFQVFSLNSLRKITEEGVLFHSHLNGDPHMFTPESTIDVQLALGSDIMMVLDECIAHPASREAARVSTERTVRWAASGDRALSRSTMTGNRAVFPIVQGSMYRRSAESNARRSLFELDARRVRDRRAFRRRAAAVVARNGGDHDSAAAEGSATIRDGRRDAGRTARVRGARRGHDGLRSAVAQCPQRLLIYAAGRISIKQTQYKEDPRPVDEACGCYTCRNFSRAYLRHLFQAGEMTFSTLATLHNLQRYLDIMREIRQAILIGKYPEYLRASRAGQ